MSRILTDIHYTLIQFFRNRQSVFFVFIFPILLLIVLGLVLESSADNINLSCMEDQVYVNIVDVNADSASGMEFLLPGILGMCIMFSSINWSMGTIARYRSTGVSRKIATTPMSGIEWNASKIFTGVLIVVISVALSLVAAIIIFGVRPDINLFSILMILAGAAAFMGIGMATAYIVEDTKTTNSIAFTITLPLMLISGSLFPVERLPWYLQFLSALSPLTSINNGLRSSMFSGNMEYAAGNLIISLISGLVLFCVGVAIIMSKEEMS